MSSKYLSLERLLLGRDLTVPVRWDELFANKAPLVLEIGFGNGEYMLRQTGDHPELNFLGIELHWESIKRTLRRLHRSDRQNVRLLQMDAQLALRHLFAPASLHEFYALFPCPWPKRSHTRNRLFSRNFLNLLHRALEPQGKGLIVTDYADFRDFVLAEAKGSGFDVRLETAPARYDTKYERRWTSEGQQEFYELHLKRLPSFQTPSFEEVVVKSRRVDELPAGGPQPQGIKGPIVVDFKRRIFDPEQNLYMFLVVATEDGLTQSFWVEVIYAGSRDLPDLKRWVIRPAEGSGVMPTAGVQKALDIIHEACQSHT
jgi:tRNA (guanine-N7-)-methyltransferase